MASYHAVPEAHFEYVDEDCGCIELAEALAEQRQADAD